MSELWMLNKAQMRRIELFSPLSHGIPRVDDRRVVSGMWWDTSPSFCDRPQSAHTLPSLQRAYSIYAKSCVSAWRAVHEALSH